MKQRGEESRKDESLKETEKRASRGGAPAWPDLPKTVFISENGFVNNSSKRKKLSPLFLLILLFLYSGLTSNLVIVSDS